MTRSESSARAFISDKPYAVPIEMRPLWRICLIVIAIAVVSGDKKYLDSKKVNILVWMLIRGDRWGEYEDFLFDRSSGIPLVSVDTATYKAVELAVGKEFIDLADGRLHLLPAGETLFSILQENEIMSTEIEFLAENGRKLTERKVRRLTGGSI